MESKGSTSRKFKLPQFKSRFECQGNPLAQSEIVKNCIQDIFESSCMSRDRFTRIEVVVWFCHYFHPNCTDIERYMTLLNIYMLFFVYDDHTETNWGDAARQYDHSVELFGQLSRIFDKLSNTDVFIPMNAWKPYSLKTFATIESIWQTYSEEQRIRFARVWKDYAQGNVEETALIHRSTGKNTLAEIVEIRMKSIAGYNIIQLAEYADNIIISKLEWEDLKIQKLMEQAILAIIFCNDIFSFEKEYFENQTDLNHMFNVVAVYALNNPEKTIEESMEKAMEWTVRETKAYECRVQELMDLIQDSPAHSETVKNFVLNIGLMVGGNYQASIELSRYDPDSNCFKFHSK